jgi:hypothetical protein
VRRLVQVGALVTLIGSGVMIGSSFTAADATGTQRTKPGVLQAAWYWQTAYEQANPPVAAALPGSEPSGVPAGDLAVAHSSNDGSSSKMTALAFDIGTLTPGTIVDSFTFSVTVDSDPQAANSPSPAVVACMPTRMWPAELAGDYTDEPAVDCSNKVTPKVRGSTYTFQITSIAQSWIDDQNLGVALVNDPDNTSAPFQVVFSGAKTVKASMTYTPGTTTTTTVPPPVTSVGGTSTTGGTAAGSSTSSSVPPPVGNVPSGGSAPTDGSAGQPPQVAPPSNPQLKPVAKITTASSAPSRGFWFGAAAFALLLLLMSLVLGEQPQAVRAGGSRLDRVLRGASTDTSALATRS